MPLQLTIRFPDALNRKVERYAKKLGLKRSDIVRLALEEFFSDTEEEDFQPYKRVKHLLGSYESGIPDLGTEHRKHLLKRFKRE